MQAQTPEEHTPTAQPTGTHGTGLYVVCEVMEPDVSTEAASAALSELRASTSPAPSPAESIDVASLTLRPVFSFRSDDAEKVAENFKDSLTGSDRKPRTPEAQSVIDEAKAVLMAQGMSENEAFKALRTKSMNTRTPMEQVAREFLASQKD